MAKVEDAKTNGNQPVRVRTKEHKEFLNATNPEAEIIWDTTIEPPSDEPNMANAADLVQSVLSAEIVPSCKHGNRILREGHGKNGAYRGWGCPIPMRNKAEQCKMIWMILDSAGKWQFRPEDEELVTG
jgi:anthranilate phosphoribosyltransferase